MESEKATEKYLIKQITRLDGLSYKWVSPQQRGAPDRICFLPHRIVICVEVKSEGRKPDKHQQRFHARLRALGHPVYVVDSKRAVDSIIKLLRRTLCI